MKEKLKEYLRVECWDEMHYGASVEDWMEIVDHFFELFLECSNGSVNEEVLHK